MELCEEMRGFCELLDQSAQGTPYCAALEAQIRKVKDPDFTPSARMLTEMRDRGEGFYHFAKRMSEIHQHFFKNLPLRAETEQYFDELAVKSLEDQRAREATDDISFPEYLHPFSCQHSPHPFRYDGSISALRILARTENIKIS